MKSNLFKTLAMIILIVFASTFLLYSDGNLNPTTKDYIVVFLKSTVVCAIIPGIGYLISKRKIGK